MFGWRFHLARALYSGVHAAALLPLFPMLGLHPRVRGGTLQRVGLAPSTQGPGPIWFHGSSAGDVFSLAPLLEEASGHGVPAVLSTRTASGMAAAGRRFPDVTTFRAPTDLGPAVTLALGRVSPRALVLECLEIWPWLVSACLARGVPVVLVNGRLSPRSLAGFARARWLFHPCLRRLSLVTALTEADAGRFIQAGVHRDRVRVLPSSKHARRGPDLEHAPVAPGGFRLVLGSVHAGEEELLLPWLVKLRDQVPGLELLVAPRYPHRAGQVARRLAAAGLEPSLLSRERGPVCVVDRMGELAGCYPGADLAFIGGSLVERGGHNVMEPASAGVPVCLGPSHGNILDEVSRLTAVGACEVIPDGEALLAAVLRQRQEPGRGEAAGRAAREVARELRRGGEAVAEALFSVIAGAR